MASAKGSAQRAPSRLDSADKCMNREGATVGVWRLLWLCVRLTPDAYPHA
jgi:hypothetical protein